MFLQIRHMSPADHLQQELPKYHWAVADSALLQSIAQGAPIQRGSAGKRLNALVKLLIKFRLVYLLLFVVGALELAKLLLRQKRESSLRCEARLGMPANHYPTCFFVGFGAGPEESLFASYCAEKGDPVARIDQTKVESMGQWHRVGVLAAFGSLLHSLTLGKQAMASLPTKYDPWKDDFLTFIGMRLGYFSYTCAWFRQLKANAPDVAEVCFLSADTAAFAAVNTGLPTRYLQHGLIRHSLVLPAFDKVDALTNAEMRHFRQRLPATDIHLARTNMTPIAPRKPACILVASVYGHHEEMRRILSFLEFAAKRGIAIHVRPHPREDRNFWHTGELPFSVLLENSDASFDAALERLRPSIVVSWFSTALVDALYRSVIPVSVSALDDSNIKDMVYPLFRHCLHWSADQDVLQRIISDDVAYETALSGLRAGME